MIARRNLLLFGVSAVAPAFTSSAPTAWAYGAAITDVNTATGTPAPTFSITSGAAPTGVTLNADGTWSGTPTASGNFTFTVTATNSAGTADQAATVLVSYASKVLAVPSLLEAWTLTGNSTYLTGLKGAYNLTNSGGTPAGGADVPHPEGGKAILEDGINDYQYNNAVAAAVNQAGFSLMVWIHDATPPTTGYQPYITAIYNINNRAQVWWATDAGKLVGTQVRASAESSAASNADPAASTWTCLVATFAPTETKFYINTTAYTAVASGSFAAAFAKLHIGGVNDGALTYYSSASLSMAAVFNGVLTPEQVAILATP